jgi:hypothetical protein
VPALSATTPRPRPLPAGRAVVRRASRDLAGPPRAHGPVARPCGGHPVSDDPCRACSGASRQRPDEQPADEPPRALSALPPATRPVAPPGTAMDHLPAASGHRRSVPRSVSGIDRRTVIETSSREFGKRINAELCLFNRLSCSRTSFMLHYPSGQPRGVFRHATALL